jgi:hypothetical protein
VARLATQTPGRVPDPGPLTERPGPTSSPGSLPAPRFACRCSPVGFDRQQKGFDFDVSEVEQIFDLLLKGKQLKLPEGCKFPTAQEVQGWSYCKWYHSFTHNTSDCKELRR